jgi:hypothetical protein
VLAIWGDDDALGLADIGGIRLAGGDLTGAERDLDKALRLWETYLKGEAISFDDPGRGVPLALLTDLTETRWRQGRFHDALDMANRSMAKVRRFSEAQKVQVSTRFGSGKAFLLSALVRRSLRDGDGFKADSELAIRVSHQESGGARPPKLVAVEARALLFLGRVDEARPLIDELVKVNYKFFHLEDFCDPDPTTEVCKQAKRLDSPCLTCDLPPPVRSAPGVADATPGSG